MAQSRMDNPETLATLRTQDTGRGQTKHKDSTQKNEKNEHHGPHQKLGVHVLVKGKQSLSLIT